MEQSKCALTHSYPVTKNEIAQTHVIGNGQKKISNAPLRERRNCRCTEGNKNVFKQLKGYHKRKRLDIFCIVLDNNTRISV